MAEKQPTKKEIKRRFQLWIKPSILALAEQKATEDNCESISEFIEKAIVFYAGYLSAEDNKSYLPNVIVSTLRGIVAESETISGNVRWGIKKRMENGEYLIPRPAFGYILQDGKIIINEVEADVVRRIFNLYLQGMGINQISDLLNEENILKPRHKENEKWKATTVRYILRNEKYMGDAILQKRYTTEALPFRRKRNYGEFSMYYVEGYNPPIVSQAVFQAVQALMDAKKTQQGERKDILFCSANNLFVGLLAKIP